MNTTSEYNTPLKWGFLDTESLINIYPLPDNKGRYTKWSTSELTLSDYVEAGREWENEGSMVGALKSIEKRLAGEQDDEGVV
jgi:hypothetical protein